MSKRSALLMQGVLASPLTVFHFLTTLQGWVDKEKAPRPEDPLHGSAFDNIKVGKPSGSQYCQKAAVNCALEFKQLCVHLQTPDYASLDAWLLGFLLQSCCMDAWLLHSCYMSVNHNVSS